MAKSPAINATSFDHVTLIVADLEATRRFYVDFLGMDEIPRPAFKFPGRWFKKGSVQIHTTQESAEAGKAGWREGGKVVSRGHHIAFAVDDVAAAVAIAEAHGVPIASPLQQRPDGYKQLYVYDPDGHVIELVSR